MAKTRREFSPEFKREAVALLESSGGPLMQVARWAFHPRCCGTGAQRLVGGYGAIGGGRAGRLVDAVASGPGVGDRAIET